MPGLRELKTRIKSVGGMRKVTRAMQMVSAAKMRKAQTAALNSRKYSELAWELIGNLTGGQKSGVIPEGRSASDGLSGIQDQGLYLDPGSRLHSAGITSLLRSFPNATKTGIIIISTNKGLVGSFNSNLMNKEREIENGLVDPSTSSHQSGTPLGPTNNSRESQEIICELLVVGKKAKDQVVRTGKSLVADFPKSDAWSPIQSIYPLAKTVSDLYQTGQYKQILIIYNKFVSTLVQKVEVKQLLPFESRVEGTGDTVESLTPDYLFEPSPELVLNHLIPRIIESQIYQAVLESDASEHSARMVMMKNATEAAGDLIDDYTLTYNQLRQNKITTELAEITAGRIALE